MAFGCVVPLESLRMTDVATVGGKNASLGELIGRLSAAGVHVPGGYATTAGAFTDFLAAGALPDRIAACLAGLEVNDVTALAAAGAKVRAWVLEAPLPPALERQIRAAHDRLAAGGEACFAVRSSATTEDLPEASFAGLHETFLNVRGIDNVLDAVRRVFASLYSDRAIAYRAHRGFAHAQAAMSAGVQRMVRSDEAAAGTVFTLDTESGFRDVVFVTASYGLGVMLAQGAVNPDEFHVSKHCLAAGRPAILRRGLGSKAAMAVFADGTKAHESVARRDVGSADRDRFSITDAEVEELARQAVAIEQHYGCPMDIEWGKDGRDGRIYVLQARPETVKSRESGKERHTRHRLARRGVVLACGRAIGSTIGQGRVRVVKDVAQIERVQQGDVLVTDTTDPSWEPVMKRAAAIVTNRGGRTCHAAIIARELGVPAVVGCENATAVLGDGDEVTVSCAEGDTGFVYGGKLEYEVLDVQFDRMPGIPVKLAMNVGDPPLAFEYCQLPNDGVGLARLDSIISNSVGVHPGACLEHAQLPAGLKAEVQRRSRGYDSPRRFYVEKIVEGVATIAAAFWPKKVIVRLSDFESNEYRHLPGGARHGAQAGNPMPGFRDESGDIAAVFRDCIGLECEAIRKVRDDMGLTNVEIMIPFVRTRREAEQALRLLRDNGLERGRNALRVVMLYAIAANAIAADEFLALFDGFCIDSDDRNALAAAFDPDSQPAANAPGKRDAPLKRGLAAAIQACRRQGKYVGVFGQGSGDYTDLAAWLMAEGIESISLDPDSVVETWLHLAKVADRLACAAP